MVQPNPDYDNIFNNTINATKENTPTFMSRGISFIDFNTIIFTINEGDKVTFHHDKNNQYDPNATQILTNQGDMLGYMPREMAEEYITRTTNGEQWHGIIHHIITPKGKYNGGLRFTLVNETE